MSTPRTTLKIAVFAPIPSASVSTPTAVRPGVRAEHAESVAKIAPDPFPSRVAPHAAGDFLDLSDVAELPACATLRRLGVGTGGHAIPRRHVEMRLHFRVEIPFAVTVVGEVHDSSAAGRTNSAATAFDN